MNNYLWPFVSLANTEMGNPALTENGQVSVGHMISVMQESVQTDSITKASVWKNMKKIDSRATAGGFLRLECDT